jgi:hypothetical protein
MTANPAPESAITWLAGFAGARPHPPGGRTGTPAERKYPPTVSPANVHGRFDAPQRPSQPPQRDDLLSLLFAQDVAHVDAGYALRLDQCPESVRSLAAFQVIIIGRF